MTDGNSAERERFEDWFKKPHGLPLTSTTARVMWEAWRARAALSACADGGKGEAAQNVMNIPLDAAATMADYAPQAECAPHFHFWAQGKCRVCDISRECAPREAQSDQQKQDDLTEVESLAKCEPEEDGSLSVNELFALQAENAAPTPKLYAHPIASADELIDGGSK